MVLVVADVIIEGYRCRHTVCVKKNWNRGDVVAALAKRFGNKNFTLGFSFEQISVG